MTARFATMQQHSNHCANTAAAGFSARAYILLDTALLAVSIIILLLARLLGLCR